MKKVILLAMLVLSACAGPAFKQTALLLKSGIVIPFDPEPVVVEMSSGSGFAVSTTLVVTAEHVCATALGSVSILYRGKPMEVVKTDKAADLCLLKSPIKFDTWMKIADHDPDYYEKITVWGFPAGWPFLFPTRGEVVAHEVRGGIGHYILSCLSYYGNSGGPVVNADGEVIGVLVGGHKNYPAIGIATSLSHLRSFLVDTGVEL